MECSFTVLYLYVIFEHYLFPVVQLSAADDLKSLLVAVFNAMLPSVLILVFGFFGFLHCWLNMWSELLQFADREFYKDWW
jgi:hypothetical protein